MYDTAHFRFQILDKENLETWMDILIRERERPEQKLCFSSQILFSSFVLLKVDDKIRVI